MAQTLGQLGTTFRNQMYNILAGGDETVPPSKDAFITWCQPGLPFQASDFGFAARGIGTGANAEEDKLLLQQAYNFASLIDFIPDVKAAYTGDRQDGVWRNDSGARLSEIYGQILKFSKVVDNELTDDQKAKLEKFRGLLRVTRKVKYITAALNYNNKRIAAQAAVGEEGKQAVADWSNNAELYRLQVNSAADDWTSGGFRSDIDLFFFYDTATTEKSMLLWKQNLER